MFYELNCGYSSSLDCWCTHYCDSFRILTHKIIFLYMVEKKKKGSCRIAYHENDVAYTYRWMVWNMKGYCLDFLFLHQLDHSDVHPVLRCMFYLVWSIFTIIWCWIDRGFCDNERLGFPCPSCNSILLTYMDSVGSGIMRLGTYIIELFSI